MTVCEGWTVLDRPKGSTGPWTIDHIGHVWQSIDKAIREAEIHAALSPGLEFLPCRLVAATDVIAFAPQAVAE